MAKNNKQEKQEIDYSLKLLVKSSIFIFIGVILSKLFSYVYRVLIVREFGLEIYGVFSLAIMVFLWFTAFTSLGLYEGLLRFIPLFRGKNQKDKIKYSFKFTLKLLILTSIFSSILLFFLSGPIALGVFHNLELAFFIKLSSAFILVYILFYLFLSVILSFERANIHSFLSDFLINLVRVLLLVIFIFLGIKKGGVIMSYLMSFFITLFIAYLYCKYKLPEVFGKYSLNKESKSEIKKELFSYSLPLILLSLLSGVLSYIDMITIGYFKGALQVGLYNSALPISELIQVFPALFIRLFSPMITREFSKGKIDIITEISKQVQKWILIVILPFTVLMVIFPGAFLNILFGPDSLEAINTLRILAISSFFISLTSVFYSLISMIGKSKIILFNILVVSVINIILNLLLVPKYGIDGAAFATMLSSLALLIIFFIQVKNYVSIIPIRRKMLRIIFCILVSTILLFYLRSIFQINKLTMIILGSVFLFAYLVLIFLTKSLDRNDFLVLKAIKQKILMQ
ncbi:MAG: flippase [Candidatus Nanoarchaeia archaeon]